MRIDGELHVEGEKPLEPYIEVVHPVTGETILLRDPAYAVVPHQRESITCDTAASFATVVETVAGANKLIELHDDGVFVYHDAIGGRRIHTVTFSLQEAPTTRVLALRGGFTMTQKQLLQWKDQWPGTLVPQANDPAATFGAITSFKAEKGTQFEAKHDDFAIRLSATVEKKGTDSQGIIPVFWRGISPVFNNHEAVEVILRMEIEVPDLDADGNLKGQLLFNFALWSPDAQAVRKQAMDDAAKQMADRLPELQIIRGKIN